MHPTYEFRPLPTWTENWPMRGDQVYRYAEGKWIPDDGEYDLAFVCNQICLMVELPYQRGIAWKWLTTHWTGHQSKHPRGNPWHYALREGETEWGGNWGRDRHPNERAGRAGMDWACARHRAASGHHVQFDLSDPHIAAGLLRERETKKIVMFPDKPDCMYCGQNWAAQKIKAARKR
jgi:hypothetical protein